MSETRRPDMVPVTIVLHRRPDGGLRVHSDTLPGLCLSGPDENDVVECVGPAIKALLEHRGEWPAVLSEAEEAAYMAAMTTITDGR